MIVGFAKFIGRFEEGIGLYWALPEGCLGSIDLTPPALDVPVVLGARHGTLLCVFAKAPADETFVPVSADDAKPDKKVFDTWEAAAGFRPAGDTIGRLAFDHLTTGADPDGLDACRPLVPQSNLWMPIWLANRVVHNERFEFGVHPYTPKLVDYLKRQFQQARADAVAGKLIDARGNVDPLGHRKRMDWWAEVLAGSREPQLKAAIAEVLRPEGWLRSETLIPHETVLQEPFTGTSATLGPNYSWTKNGGGNAERVSDQFKVLTAGARCRCDSDLSGGDHYSQATAVTRSANMEINVRYNSANQECYVYIQNATQTRLFKLNSAGTTTQIGSTVSQAWLAAPFLMRLEITSSNLAGLMGGTTYITATDSTIGSSNVRCGLGGSAGTGQIFDDWEAGDISSTTPVSASLSCAYESLAPVSQTQGEAFESLAPASQTQGAAWESNASSSTSQGPGWESLAPVTQTQASPWESLAPISATSPAAWESLLLVSPSKTCDWESLGAAGGVSQTQACAWESLAPVSAIAAEFWESLAPLAASLGVPWESSAPVTASLTVPWESRAAPAQSIGPADETFQFADRGTVFTLRERGTVFDFVPR